MNVSSENMEGRDNVIGRKMFEFNVNKYDVWVWSGISCFRFGYLGGIL